MGARKTAKTKEADAECSVATNSLSSRVTRSSARKFSGTVFIEFSLLICCRQWMPRGKCPRGGLFDMKRLLPMI